MTSAAPFEAMAFRYPWRDYQAQVLAQLAEHLENEKLHVAAAPGAGKTVLGLEVVRRLARPTLVLAPSLAIRNQWIDRLVESFLPDGAGKPDWVTTDLGAPCAVTVTTYQALHSSGDAEVLARAGIEVVVLDEAHHLRRAWWEALDRAVTRLGARTVSLTATPPYDVASVEWRRYDALCGPLDAEISVPELVKTGDLAPHQDLVHQTILADAARYGDLDRTNVALREGLRARDDMCTLIAAHPWLAETRAKLEALLSEPQLFAAMLVYLADARRPIPREALRVLGVGQAEVPQLSDDWLGTLCHGLKDTLPDAVIAHLKRHGALVRGRVTIPLRDEDDRRGILRNAAEKYDSLREITAFERGQMGDRLRLAILAEHVGAGAVRLATSDPGYFEAEAFRARYRADPRLGRLDAGSIFERLRLEPGAGGDMAVLTGSLCIVPAGALTGDGVAARPLPHDPRYEELTLTGAASNRRVALVSDLMAQGRVRVLIGTRSLLGQGWDLPALNTLILATNVASFVSSNQIRGRAIRRDPADPGKAANIWHIATRPASEPGPEIEALRARFDTFVHLDPELDEIRSGFAAFDDLESLNARSMAHAARRGDLGARWQAALITGSPEPHLRHQIETDQAPRGLVRTDAVAQTVPRLGAVGAMAGGWAAFLGDPLTAALGLGAAGLVLAPAVKRLRRVMAHGTLAGSLRETGLALLYAMSRTGLIQTDRAQLDVVTGMGDQSTAWCTLTGATLPEETRFLSQLEAFFAPIDNPRYLLFRESYLGRRLRLAPYPVPPDLARRRDDAAHVLEGWQRHVGPARLVYTRTVEGRLALLQARTVTLAEARDVRRSSVWE